MFGYEIKNKNWQWLTLLVFGLIAMFAAREIIAMVNSLFACSISENFWQHSIIYCGSFLIAGAIFLFGYRLSKNLWWAIAVVIGHHLIWVMVNAVDFPLTDDYGMLLSFAVDFIRNATTENRLNLLSGTYNETRPVLNRFLFLSYYHLSSSLNFATYTILVNVLFMAIIPVMYFLVDRSLAWLAIFAILVFTISSYDTYLWASTANYLFCVLFATMAILFATKNKTIHFVLSLVAGAACLLSFGNGILLFPLLILFFLLNKKYVRAATTFLLCAVLVVAYLFQYSYWPTQNFSLPTLSGFFSYAVVFAGSSFQFMYQYWLPAIAGSILLAACIHLLYKKAWLYTPLFYLLLFLWGSAFIAALFRSNMGLAQAFSNRYMFYSALIIATTLMCYQHLYPLLFKRNFKIILIGCIGIRMLGGIFFYPEAALRKQRLMELQRQYCNGQQLQPDQMIVPGEATMILDKARQNNMYDCCK
ncbi:MAG: hypothetical protein IPO27_06675 [Bacteroidetes bacterium]|nr:hypothetical protein [Bacteroidota bacterium]